MTAYNPHAKTPLMVAMGAKGGEKQPRPPVEAPDTLSNTSSAKLLDLISEGEIVGLVNGAKSIYLDETPLQSDSGFNFGGVAWQERHGTLYQSYIKGFPNAESETSVNFELKQSQSYVRAINKLELSAVRIRMSFARLQSQDSQGNTNGASVSYRIELQTDGGAWVLQENATVTGKASSNYQKTHRVNLPEASQGWLLRVTRTTADSSSNSLINPSVVAAIVEVIDAKFVYPNSALIATQFDAQSFSGIPKRTFHIKGRIIKVPSNYDAESRIYSGLWDGTFKPAYTNNPAWIYYDLLLHKRYGLGDRITAAQVDKWELYRIGQHCDQMVPDGKGGMEPRFTCNLYLQDRAPALKVMQDLASIFRGISYWGAGQVFVSSDMPGDADHTFTNAQVVDGMFTYKGAPLESRYNVALVSWNDPTDFYRAKVEYVEDKEGIAKFGGINKVELVAFGCSSQGQAQRAGRWALLTNKLETEIVSFRVPLEGAFIRPGRIIRIADNDLAGRRIGGRIVGSSATSITVDKAGLVVPGDVVTVMLDNEPVDMTVATFDANTATIGFTREFADGIRPAHMTPWAIESQDLALTEWRVSSISDNEDCTFSITASKHVRGKFDAVESGTVLEQRPITVIPPSVQPPVAEVRLSSDWGVDQTMAVTTMTVAWDEVPEAIYYEVQWRVNDKDWIYAGRSSTTEFDVVGIYAGRYVARVQVVNGLDIRSQWTTSRETVLLGKDGEPPKVSFLRTLGLTFGIGIEWGFLPGSTDTLRTEIQYSRTPNPDDAILLGDFAYPINTHTVMGLAAGARFWFRARLHDRTGNTGQWSDMVEGMASNQATDILGYLQGQITQTELGADLAQEIGKISGDGDGSVNERVKEVQDALNFQIEVINSQLAELTGAPDWKVDVNYEAGDLVKHDGKLWRATAANIGSEPPSLNWEKIGDYASIGDAVAAMAVQIQDLQTSVTNIDGDLVALTRKYDGIFAQVNPPMAGSMSDYAGSTSTLAGVWSERYARATSDEALGVRIDGMVAQVGENRAAITEESRVRASADDALAEQIVAMSAEIEQNIGPVLTQIRADLAEESRVRADETGALAQQQTTLETKVGENTTAVSQALSTVNRLDGEVSAMYSVKMQVTAGEDIKFAGFGLGTDNSSGVLESRFIIAADQFYIASSLEQGYKDVPFAIINGQTFLKEAFIQDGTIDMLKIGSNLQSSNYVPGVSGWAFLPNGEFQMMGNSPGGNRLMINNSGLFIFYPNGVKAIDLSVDVS